MYKVGQEVRVVDNNTSHGFEVGEVVKIRTMADNGEVGTAEHLDGSEWWWIDEEDVEPITENE